MWSVYDLTEWKLREGQNEANTGERILTLNPKDRETEECIMC